MVSKPPAPNSSRYRPPVRTAISHDRSETPDTDFGIHQRRNSSGWLHALKTVLGGASNIRVTTSSRSPLRSTDVRFCAPPTLLACRFIASLLFQFSDEFVQGFEAGLKKLAVRLDPLGLRLEAVCPKLAGSHPSDLLRNDEPRPLENLDMLLHAGQRHLELFRQTGDRRVRLPKLIDNPPACRIG